MTLPKQYNNFPCSSHFHCLSTNHTNLKRSALKRKSNYLHLQMYCIKSKNISTQPAPKLPFHVSYLPFHLVLYVSNTAVQTQGKRQHVKEGCSTFPISVNTGFINLIDVKFHSSFFPKN